MCSSLLRIQVQLQAWWDVEWHFERIRVYWVVRLGYIRTGMRSRLLRIQVQLPVLWGGEGAGRQDSHMLGC
jgi:hypothetical protein